MLSGSGDLRPVRIHYHGECGSLFLLLPISHPSNSVRRRSGPARRLTNTQGKKVGKLTTKTHALRDIFAPANGCRREIQDVDASRDVWLLHTALMSIRIALMVGAAVVGSRKHDVGIHLHPLFLRQRILASLSIRLQHPRMLQKRDWDNRQSERHQRLPV